MQLAENGAKINASVQFPSISQIFPVHTTLVEFKTQQSQVIVNWCFRKTWPGKSHYFYECFVVEKFRFQNAFHRNENEKKRYSKSSGFENFRSRDGLVWTVGQTVNS